MAVNKGVVNKIFSVVIVLFLFFAFSSTRSEETSSKGKIIFERKENMNEVLYIMNSDGSEKRKLLTLTSSIGNLAFSPSGERLAISTWQGIYIINVDGTGQKKLTKCKDDFGNCAPTWSPDEKKIAFLNQTFGGGKIDPRYTLYVINADGTGIKRLSKMNEIYSHLGDEGPVWSPDGKKIAFSGESGLYIINADGTGRKKIVKGIIQWPTWSPDGKKNAFLISQSLKGFDEIAVINIEGTELKKLAKGWGGLDFTLVWSPDGTKIAFELETNNQKYIYIANADGSEVKRLVKGWDPVWLPDGKKIIFESEGGLYIVNLDGSGLKKLANMDASNDSGIYQDKCLLPNEKKLVFIKSNIKPNEYRENLCDIYIINIEGTELKRLTYDGTLCTIFCSPY